MREQIASYLAQGYKPAAIAQMLGCSEAYISELFKEDLAFKELLKAKMLEFAGERINQRYNRLEEDTLDKIDTIVKSEMLEVNDLTRILEAVAKIKNANRSSITPPSHYQNPTIGVVINMPVQNIPEIAVDDKNRVISIGTRTMLPMPAKAVRDAFQQRMKDEVKEEEPTLEKLAHG